MRRAAAGLVDGLPRAARRLLLVTVATAAVASTAALVLDPAPLRPLAVLVLLVAIAGGEGVRVDLPYRRAGVARFTLGDAALTSGLLLAGGGEVLLAAVGAIVFWQLAERVAPVKFAVNVAMYLAAAALAALVVEGLAPSAAGLTPARVLAVGLAMAVFLATQTLVVSGIIAFTSTKPWPTVVRRLAPISALLAIGNAGLGVLGVVVAGAEPWALPALVVPLVLLFSASRQEVHAQLDRERSAAFVAVEQRLSAAATPDAVADLLVEAVGAILGCTAAVWREGSWVTPVPDGSGPCPLDAGLSVALPARGHALGIAMDGPCLAVGAGGGVLVAWAGELGLDSDAGEWLERLGRSGRASFDRAAAQALLTQERATLRAVVGGTADGILVSDPSGILRLWNPAMARLASADAADVLGRHVVEVLGEGPWTEPGVHDVVARRSGADAGDERTWRVSVAPVTDEDGGELAVAVVHDISAERRVARMKDDMLAVVSHELRTPLTPIKASAQLLHRRWDRLTEPQRVHLLGQIEHRADHLARLVDDLLLVGQLSVRGDNDAGPRVTPVPVDLAALVRDDVAQLALGRTDHELVLHAPEQLATVTDPLRVRQVLDNLVDNACKFSPVGARIDVRLHAAGDSAVLSVADSGRGIPPEDLDRIFDRFERVEDPLHMTTSGAGLGLSIVKALCEALGGSVAVTSTLGAGSTFTVRLPILAPHADFVEPLRASG